MLTFVIAGGGPTGVECAGALSELIRMALQKDNYPLDFRAVRVVLLEATDRLLAAMPEDLGRFTADVLERKHVEIRFQTAVSQYDGEIVQFRDGATLPAHTLIWAAGVRASRLLDGLGVEQDRLGRVKVQPSLQISGHPEVFVIGDAAHIVDLQGAPLPMLAPVAMQQGEQTARNIHRLVAGAATQAFRYHDPGVLATIGRNQAVARLGKWKFTGLLAWLVWVVVHILQLIGFRNRLAVLLDWAWSYIFYERAARLIGPV